MGAVSVNERAKTCSNFSLKFSWNFWGYGKLLGVGKRV